MYHSKFQKVLDFVARASLDSETKLPIWVWGKHGQGKTTAVKNWCKENDYRCIVLYTASQDPGDLIGIPDTFIDADGNKRTEWPKPEWMPLESSEEKIVIFLDELNRARPDVLQCMLPFALEGKLHTHKLPKNAIVVAAGNPDNDDYSVTAVEDKALLSRFGHFTLEADADEWRKRIVDRGAEHYDNSMLQVVIKDNYNGLDNAPIILDSFERKPDPRALELLATKLIFLTNEEKSSIGSEIISGFIGSHYANMWLKEQEKDLETVEATDVLENWNKKIERKVRDLDDVKIGKGTRNDAIMQITGGIILYFEEKVTKSKGKINFKTVKMKKVVDNLCRFMLSINEGAIRALVELVRKKKESDFSDLLSAISVSKVANKDGKTVLDLLTDILTVTK